MGKRRQQVPLGEGGLQRELLGAAGMGRGGSWKLEMTPVGHSLLVGGKGGS